MAANSPIGDVTSIVLQTRDPNGNVVKTTLNSSFAINSEATYNNVDLAMRAIANLSKNTYVDTILVTEISTNAAVE